MKISEVIKKAKRLGFRLGFMKMIGYEGVFTCCYNNGDSESEFIPLPHSDRFWYADPLAFTYENNTYVFMEAFDRETCLGKIAYARLTEQGWGKVQEVIAEPFHLSFPTVFVHRGSIYMLPETSTAGKIVLYKCRKFPDEWEKAAEFLEGKCIVDSVVLSQDLNSVTILASECNPLNPLQTKFFKYKIEIGEDGQAYCASEDSLFNCHQQYSFFYRNAGAVRENGLISLQRSTPAIYGYSVVMLDSDQMMEHLESEGHIAESDIVYEILPNQIKIAGKEKFHLMGIHTYSESEKYTIIDVQYLEYNAKKWKHGKK